MHKKLLLLSGILFLGACTTPQEETQVVVDETMTDTNAGEENTTANNAVPAAGSNTLIIQQSADVPTLDPGTVYDTSSSQIVENLYETLVTYDGASISKLKPLLATDTIEENNGLTYRFPLREGVKFHSGNDMTCADAEYTFERNLVTNASSSGNWFLSESLLGTPSNANDDENITWEMIDNAVQCDGNTLVFNLPKVDPSFVSKLAYTGQGIVDKQHAIEIGEWDGTEATWRDAIGVDLDNSPLSQSPSGTGAYKLINRDTNTISAQRFDDYWGGVPEIETVVIQIVPEESTRVQALTSGDADFIEVSSGRPLIDKQLRDQAGVSILDDLPDTYVFGISMNQNVKDPVNLGSAKLDGQGIPADFFSDVNVRRGFVAAFDPQTIIDQAQNGVGQPRNFMLPDTFFGYDPSIPAPAFDMAAAEDYFKQAWDGQVWENGFTISAAYRQGSEGHKLAMEMLKANLESLNPKFHLNLVEKQWSEILADARAGKEAVTVATWAPDYADPDNFVYTFYDTNGYYNVRTGISDPELDKLIDEARNVTDETRRKELYSEIAKRAIDKAYFVMMPTNPSILAYNEDVQGLSKETYNPMRGSRFGLLWNEVTKK